MIQDDKREKELLKLFDLHQDEDRKRHDADATLNFNTTDYTFELKSTTVGCVSTARNVNIDHLNKWEKCHWIIGVYEPKTVKLQHCYYAPPSLMKPWIDYQREDINRGITLSYQLKDKVDLPMMYSIFGEKDFYNLKEVKYVIRKLYNLKEYKEKMDLKGGYSKERLLEMFKEHNLSYLIKGSYLNNPKIQPKFYKKWYKIENNYKDELRNLLIKLS